MHNLKDILAKLSAALRSLDAVIENFKNKKQKDMSNDEAMTNLPDGKAGPNLPATPEATPKYRWGTPQDARHSVRLIADEEGLTVKQKNDMCATVECESGFNPTIVVHNCMLNTTPRSVRKENYDPAKHGRITTTDYGICQINDYFHIGPNKEFPSEEYVLENPEKCIRWMCTCTKGGLLRLWVCYQKGMYKQYL